MCDARNLQLLSAGGDAVRGGGDGARTERKKVIGPATVYCKAMKDFGIGGGEYGGCRLLKDLQRVRTRKIRAMD